MDQFSIGTDQNGSYLALTLIRPPQVHF